MRIPRWLFWLVLYGAATFGWMVYFEHGPGWERFWAGARAEVGRGWGGLERWAVGRAGK